MLGFDDVQPFPVENETIEYKEIFNEKCKKEIAAFLNGSQTAYIYFGVNDKSRQITRLYTDNEKHEIEEQVGRWLSSPTYYQALPITQVRLVLCMCGRIRSFSV